MGKFDRIEHLPDGSVEINDLVTVGGAGNASANKVVGFTEIGPMGLTEADGLIPLIDGYTVTGGATTYPLFAAAIPSFVSGADLVVPVGMSGAAIRNLGGNANAFMVPQADAIGSHSHTYTEPNSPTSTQVNNGGGNTIRGRTGSRRTGSTGGTETRMQNFGMQVYLKLDNY